MDDAIGSAPPPLATNTTSANSRTFPKPLPATRQTLSIIPIGINTTHAFQHHNPSPTISVKVTRLQAQPWSLKETRRLTRTLAYGRLDRTTRKPHAFRNRYFVRRALHALRRPHASHQASPILRHPPAHPHSQ